MNSQVEHYGTLEMNWYRQVWTFIGNNLFDHMLDVATLSEVTI